MYQIVMFQTDLYTYALGKNLLKLLWLLNFKILLQNARISQFQQNTPLTWGIYFNLDIPFYNSTYKIWSHAASEKLLDYQFCITAMCLK
jgi:hypothetical protein